MAPIILATYPAGQKLYQLAGTTWSLFPNQPPAVSEGVWGGPNDTIWIHNRYYNGPVITPKYYRFDGAGTWDEFTSPSTFPDGGWYVSCIHGSIDGSIVYAGYATQSSGGGVHKFSGGTWTDLGVSFRAGSIWCDETGQYVWASCGDGSSNATLEYSDDYGATWTSKRAQMVSDLGLTYYDTNGTPCGVWGTDENNVYMATGWNAFPPPEAPGPGHGGCVLKWNGSTFEFVSINSGFECNYFLCTPPWSDGTRHIMAGGYGYSRISRDESGILVKKKDTGYYDSTRGRSVMGLPSGGDIVTIVNGIFGNGAEALVSSDDGDTWSNTNDVWGGNAEGLQGLTVANYVTQFPPVLQNESPTDGTFGVSSTASTYQEITDPNGDIDVSLTEIYIDAVLAWSAGAPQSGFTGSVSSISLGYAYTVTPTTPFTQGPHTVRVVAEDSVGNTLDESRSFSVGTCGYVQWGFVQWGQHQWGETQLAPTVTPVSPTNGATDVDRDASIVFDITSPYSFDVAASTFYVGGKRVYYGAANSFDGDWSASSFAAITNGSRVTLVPNMFAKYDLGQIVTVRVITGTDLGCEADVQWSFTVTFDAAFRLRIYHMLLGSVRRMNEVD